MRSRYLQFAYAFDTRTQSLNPENRNQVTQFNLRNHTRVMENKGVSILYFSEGQAQFRVDGHTYHLEAGNYLLINHRHRIEWHPGESSSVKGLFINLNLEWIETVCRQLQGSMNGEAPTLLKADCGRVEVYEHVYPAKGEFGGFLTQLSQVIRKGNMQDAHFEEELVFELTARLLRAQHKVFYQIERLTSAKLSTRKELFRRLRIAQHYMHRHLEEALDLNTLAEVACLSKFHFIRLFKEVFGQTPRQYLISLRLHKASEMLLDSDKSFNQICHEVGLKDSSSFGRLFKKTYGTTPQIYRQQQV